MGEGNAQAGANMRKSCQFCRSRKMRCSGGRICNTCRARSIDCIYGREGSKGRPRLDRMKEKKSPPVIRDSASSTYFSDKSSVGSSSTHDIINGDWSPLQSTIGSDLEHLFDLQFGNLDLDRSSHINPSNRQPEPLREEIIWDPDKGAMVSVIANAGYHRKTSASVNYEELFFSISHSIVELTAGLFGSLQVSPTLSPHSRIFAERLSSDSTVQMFDFSAAIPQSTPLTGDEHHVRQLIELWFAHHPLSVLLSKTLLLNQMRSKQVNRHLLAVILAGASYILGQEFHAKGRALFASAIESLRLEKQKSMDLATIQAIVILSWHELCYASARRARCLQQLALRGIIEIENRSRADSQASSDYINGVAVADVELELLQRLYWFCMAINLWTCLQLRVPVCDNLPKNEILALPALDGGASAVLALDTASGNVANLQFHKRLMRLLWPLGHLTSTLLPWYRHHPVTVNAPENYNLRRYRLSRILDMNADVTALCKGFSHALEAVTAVIDVDAESHVSYVFVVTAYRILLLHLFYPRKVYDNSHLESSPSMITDSMRTFVEYKRFLSWADKNPPVEYGIIDTPKRCNETLFAIGLDAIARFFQRLISQHATDSDAHRSAWFAHRDEICILARQYAQICQHPRLQIASGLQEVKDIFQKVNLDLGNLTCVEMPGPADDATFAAVTQSMVSWPTQYAAVTSAETMQLGYAWDPAMLDTGLDWTAYH